MNIQAFTSLKYQNSRIILFRNAETCDVCEWSAPWIEAKLVLQQIALYQLHYPNTQYTDFSSWFF